MKRCALFLLFLILAVSAVSVTNETCPDYCASSYYYSNGIYDARRAACVYESTYCRYGCAGDACAEEPAPAPSCDAYCADRTYYYNGGYNERSGECEYEEEFCPSGCDEAGCSEEPAPAPSCDAYCAAGIYYYDGIYSSRMEQCVYSQTVCEYGCSSTHAGCAEPPAEPPAQTPDCPDFCGVKYRHYDGKWNETTQQCDYQLGQCAWGCDAEHIGCLAWNKCGNGVCEASVENKSNCFSDCHCGDGTCDANWENATNCPLDCLEMVVVPPITPLYFISNVEAKNITGESATITWDTSFISDAKVSYWSKLKSAKAQYSASKLSAHSLLLTGLSSGTNYSFYVESCGPQAGCLQAGNYSFFTSGSAPYVKILTAEQPDDFAGFYPSGYQYQIEHGESAVFKFIVEEQNPDGKITEVLVEWEDYLSYKDTPCFGGALKNGKKCSLFHDPRYAAFSITWENPGTHSVTLTATNNLGQSASDTVQVLVKPKKQCLNTDAIYYHSDTECDNDWATGSEGKTVGYNSDIPACSGFEVCSPALDYIAQDAETCCNGQSSFTGLPVQYYYSYDKQAACDKAVQDALDFYPDGIWHPVGDKMKYCKAAYVIDAFGPEAVYMKDYFHGELCCAGHETHCGENGPVPNIFLPYVPHIIYPWPESNTKHKEMWCRFNCGSSQCGIKTEINSNGAVTSISGTWATPATLLSGWWKSDTGPKQNNMNNFNPPTHVTVNIINTGICTDYSLALTTALRKLGYRASEVYSTQAPLHSYNLVWFPGETKYSLVDTTGNNAGILTGTGITWSKALKNMDEEMMQKHLKYSTQCYYDEDGDQYVCLCSEGKNSFGDCVAKINSCYYYSQDCTNDLGWFTCPSEGMVKGCIE